MVKVKGMVLVEGIVKLKGTVVVVKRIVKVKGMVLVVKRMVKVKVKGIVKLVVKGMIVVVNGMVVMVKRIVKLKGMVVVVVVVKGMVKFVVKGMVVVLVARTSLSPKGDDKYRISPALNYTVHPDSSIHSQYNCHPTSDSSDHHTAYVQTAHHRAI